LNPEFFFFAYQGKHSRT